MASGQASLGRVPRAFLQSRTEVIVHPSLFIAFARQATIGQKGERTGSNGHWKNGGETVNRRVLWARLLMCTNYCNRGS